MTHLLQDRYFKNSSGFANSTGGILIIGVDEKTWSITGCSAPGGGDLKEWASRTLTPIFSYFSPSPRFLVVKHAKGYVLVIAVERSAVLVPVIEAGLLVHYLRFGEQTLQAPDYLMSDLVLGRRQHPRLKITDFRLIGFDISASSSLKHIAYNFRTVLGVENQGLRWAEHVKIGMISLNFINSPEITPPLNSQLLSYLDVQDSSKRFDIPCKIAHVFVGCGTIEPFATQSAIQLLSVDFPVNSERLQLSYKWQAAIYLVTKDSPPEWYQVTFLVDRDVTMFHINNIREVVTGTRLLYLEPRGNERPFVGWQDMIMF